MSFERQRRIDLLVRRNEAKVSHPYYLTELSHILKQHFTEEELLDLETTDNLFARSKNACGGPGSCVKKTWPLNPTSVWTWACSRLGKELGDEPVALFVGPFHVCGAVRTKAQYPLRSAELLLEFDKDTLTMQSLSSDGGLYLDRYEERSTPWVELKVWGSWNGLAASVFS
jgi:hypothetical protein